jgi:hypothetical protein
MAKVEMQLGMAFLIHLRLLISMVLLMAGDHPFSGFQKNSNSLKKPKRIIAVS